MKILVVLSLFNEEAHILEVLKGIEKTGLPIVVVDDGSTDNSKQIIRKSGVKRLTLIEHAVNLGKGAAMKTGAEYAFRLGYQAVIFMDSDGQHSYKDIGRFVDVIEEGNYDVVFGSRNLNLGVPLVRYLGNKVASLFVGLLFGIYISDLICGFRAVTKKGYEKVKWESTGYSVETEMVVRTSKAKSRFVELPVETIYINRVKGVTILDAFGILFSVLKLRLGI